MDLTCPYCGFNKKVPEEKISINIKWAICPMCGQRFKIPTPDRYPDFVTEESEFETRYHGLEEQTEKESMSKGSPWENRSELGLWKSIFQTIKEVLFTPDAFFSGMIFRGGFREPLAFGLLVGSLGGMVGAFWQVLLMSGGLLFMDESLFGQVSLHIYFLSTMAFVPIIVIFAIFISSLVLHVLLAIVRGANNGYEATFRVISYSQAVQVWGFIPFIGTWISWIWQLIVQVIGLREIHKTSYARVMIAFLIPVGVIFLLVIGAVFIVFTLITRQQLGQSWS